MSSAIKWYPIETSIWIFSNWENRKWNEKCTQVYSFKAQPSIYHWDITGCCQQWSSFDEFIISSMSIILIKISDIPWTLTSKWNLFSLPLNDVRNMNHKDWQTWIIPIECLDSFLTWARLYISQSNKKPITFERNYSRKTSNIKSLLLFLHIFWFQGSVSRKNPSNKNANNFSFQFTR